MKRIILCLVFLVSMIGFSETIELDGKYNKNSNWSICVPVDSLKKDCSLVFKGNPYKEFTVYEAEEPHGMYIEYRGMAIVNSNGGDLEIIETKTKKIPKKTRSMPIDKNLAEALTIAVGSEKSNVMGLLPAESFAHLKKFGKNVYYFNMAFINHTVYDGSSIN